MAVGDGMSMLIDMTYVETTSSSPSPKNPYTLPHEKRHARTGAGPKKKSRDWSGPAMDRPNPELGPQPVRILLLCKKITQDD